MSRTLWLHNSDGEPVAFLFEGWAFDVDGEPLGKLHGREVWTDVYVGEIIAERYLLHKVSAPRRLLPPATRPPIPPVPEAPHSIGFIEPPDGYADLALTPA